MLGDTETAALVSRDGLDRLAVPAPVRLPRVLRGPAGRPRSTAGGCSARGTRPGAPAGTWRTRSCSRRVHETDTGAVKVLDLMPIGDGRADIIRSVEGVRGTVTDAPRVGGAVRLRQGAALGVARRGPPAGRATSSPRSPGRTCSSCAAPGCRGPTTAATRDEFEVHGPARPRRSRPPGSRPTTRCRRRWTSTPGSRETIRRSDDWAARCDYDGPLPRRWCVRSLLTLRADDALAVRRHRRGARRPACPRTSAASATGTTATAGCATPRSPSRRCWRPGYVDEARLWRNWLLRAVAGDPEDLQIMYTIDGSRRLPERTLDHLPGYAGSAPGAHRQRRGGPAADRRARRGDDRARRGPRRRRSRSTARHGRCSARWSTTWPTHWQEPDNGLWEIRGPLRHFTHSRVMVWAAFDRAVRGVEDWGLPGDVDRWRDAARPGPRRDAQPRASTPSATPSPSTTTPPRSTPRCCSSRWSASCPPTTPGCSAPSPPSSRTSCATASCCATAPRAASTASPATSTRSSPARGGWSARMRCAAR